MENKSGEKGGESWVLACSYQRMVVVMDSLGTAGRRAGHTRLQQRLPLGPAAGQLLAACPAPTQPTSYSTAPTYSSLLLISGQQAATLPCS